MAIKISGNTVIDNSQNITVSGTSISMASGPQGSTATPSKIDLGINYSNGSTRDKCKIYLYNTGTEQYGFSIGAAGDIQHHSNAYHNFYIANTHIIRMTGNEMDFRNRIIDGGVGTRISWNTDNNVDRITMLSFSTNATTYMVFGNNNGTIGSITTGGSTTSFNTTSDYRLKENVVTISDGIYRLKQLKPSRFNFISAPSVTIDGFLAHEVQTVIPESITGEKDAVDEEGKPIFQCIDQSKLVPLLTAALQEAISKIESLEARLSAAGIE